MERIELKYNSSLQSLKTLKEVLEEYDKTKRDEDEKMRKIYRDSVIQRFEYCVDTIWKYLKEYLSKEKGIAANAPKTVFKELGRANLIGEEEIVQALKMVDDRNLTSHIYHEEKIEEMIPAIPGYYKLMKNFVENVTPTKTIFT